MKTYGYNPVSLGLEVVHQMSDYCLCNCVFHDDSKPSMAFYITTGNFYCFGCGEYGTIEKLNKVTGGYIERGLVEVNTKGDNTLKEYWNVLTRLKVNDNDEYLLKRGITKEQINKYNIMSDDDKIVIPFFTGDEITGVKMRWKEPNGKTKYMNFGKQPLLFGDEIFNENEIVFVIEGVLGFFHFNNHNIKCVSTLSSTRVNGYDDIFNNYPLTQFRIMFDPDNAGYYGASKLLYLNRFNENVVGLETFYDVDNMNDEQFKEVLETCKITKNPFTYDDKFDTIKNKRFYKTVLTNLTKKRMDKRG